MFEKEGVYVCRTKNVLPKDMSNMKNRNWIVKESITDLSLKADISPLVLKVLSSRGLKSEQEVYSYLSTSQDMMNDPFIFEQMGEAVKAIKTAILQNDKIAVYGDYDVDGITATCILTKYIVSIGGDCVYYIPDRITEGYGINADAIKTLSDLGVKLLITVDTGITAVKETEEANTYGISVIITDHHECKDELPHALVVINPKCSEYPFKELAGVGVAFKLICALDGDSKKMLMEYSDLLTLGTVADVMPLRGENRAIVNYGIENMLNTKNIGLSALLFHSGLIGKEKKKLTSTSVSFGLAPKINAAGRFSNAQMAMELFITDDLKRADELASKLCDMNSQRQKIEAEIFEEAERMLCDFDINEHRGIVLWHENWHNGVIGIVASKITEKYFCPTILISVTDGVCKGSGRSIRGFNLFEALKSSSELLNKFGGHELAAGISLDEKNLEEFKREFVNYADTHLTNTDCVPYLEIDCEAQPNDFTIQNVSDLDMLEPFGMGNQQPKFLLQNMTLQTITSIGNDKHLKLTFYRDGRTFDAILFKMCSSDFDFLENDIVDIAFCAEINTFRIKAVQLVIKDIKLCQYERELDCAYVNIYSNFCNNCVIEANVISSIRPAHDELVAIWRYISKNAVCGTLKCSPNVLYRKIRYEYNKNLNICKLLIALDVFNEFSLLRSEYSDDILTIEILKTKGKIDITGSAILARLLKKND